MASTKGKEIEGDSASERRKVPLGHFHDVVSPTRGVSNPLLQGYRAPGLDLLPIPSAFCHHLGDISKEIVLKTDTGCKWRITIVDHNGCAVIDNGWAAFAMCHNIKIGHFLIFKMLKPTVYRVTIFSTDGIKIVKCDEHPVNMLLQTTIQKS